MPKSSVRKKKVYTPPAELRPQTTATAKKPSPTWLPATAVGLVLFAVLWLVVYYLTNSGTDPEIPLMSSLHAWNFAVGFGVMLLGLVMAVRWR